MQPTKQVWEHLYNIYEVGIKYGPLNISSIFETKLCCWWIGNYKQIL